ncbi:hypothetical protein Lalb_Chr02g0160551 [Lupinus albus]|uniref:Uncharacterized protein n=1 Tax=Lupinus albus TaxID=3870 RepID=A0A6A4R2A0_LUPAL|nr:hypothetical protein Lalb_Chr02g0160551 [Lupinus albus]
MEIRVCLPPKMNAPTIAHGQGGFEIDNVPPTASGIDQDNQRVALIEHSNDKGLFFFFFVNAMQ